MTANGEGNDVGVGGADEENRAQATGMGEGRARRRPSDRLVGRVVVGALIWLVAAFVPIAGPWSVLGLCRIAFGQGVLSGLSALTSIGGPSLLAALLLMLWWLDPGHQQAPRPVSPEGESNGEEPATLTTLKSAIRGLTTVFHAQLVVIAWNLWRASEAPSLQMVAPWSLLGFAVVGGIYLAYRTAQAGAEQGGTGELSIAWHAHWLGIVVLGLCGWLRLQVVDGIALGWALEVYALGALLLVSTPPVRQER